MLATRRRRRSPHAVTPPRGSAVAWLAPVAAMRPGRPPQQATRPLALWKLAATVVCGCVCGDAETAETPPSSSNSSQQGGRRWR